MNNCVSLSNFAETALVLMLLCRTGQSNLECTSVQTGVYRTRQSSRSSSSPPSPSICSLRVESPPWPTTTWTSRSSSSVSSSSACGWRCRRRSRAPAGTSKPNIQVKILRQVQLANWEGVRRVSCDESPQSKHSSGTFVCHYRGKILDQVAAVEVPEEVGSSPAKVRTPSKLHHLNSLCVRVEDAREEKEIGKGLATIEDVDPSAVRLRQSVEDGANVLETIVDDKPGAVRPRQQVIVEEAKGREEPMAIHRNEKKERGLVVSWPEETSRGLIAGKTKGEKGSQVLATDEKKVVGAWPETSRGLVGAWPENTSRGLIAGKITGGEVPNILAAGEEIIVEEANDGEGPMVIHRNEKEERGLVVTWPDKTSRGLIAGKINGGEVPQVLAAGEKVENEESFNDKKRMDDEVDSDVNKCKSKKSLQQEKSETISEKESHSKGKKDKKLKVKVKPAVDSSVKSNHKGSTDATKRKVCDKNKSTVGVSHGENIEAKEDEIFKSMETCVGNIEEDGATVGVSRSGGVIEGAGLLLAPRGQARTRRGLLREAGENFYKVGVFGVKLSNFEKVSPAGWKCLGASLNALSARVFRGWAVKCPEKESPAVLATTDQPKTRQSDRKLSSVQNVFDDVTFSSESE